MSYLNCPRCGLSVRARPDELPPPVCPRCRGRTGLRVPMYETDRLRPPVSTSEGDAPAARPDRPGPEREPQAA